VTRRFRRTSTFRNPRWVLGSAGDEEFEEAHARLVTGVLTIPFVMQDPRAWREIAARAVVSSISPAGRVAIQLWDAEWPSSSSGGFVVDNRGRWPVHA
jgi:hypothetical protein